MLPISPPLLGLRMRKANNFAGLPAESSEACGHGERINTMLVQSKSTYSCADYIGRRSKHENNACHSIGQAETTLPDHPVDHDKIDTVCREKMCEWSYRVCDHFQTGREIVAVSFSYLDRFVDKCSCDRSAFKLAAMTTLYLANKIYGGPHTLTIGALAELSRGEFQASHISEMEVIILQTLNWRLHPPTTQCFIDSFYNYVSIPSNGSMSIAIYRRAIFFAELSLYDYAFASKERSLLAICSLMNAMEGMENVTVEQQTSFLNVINLTFDLKHTTDSVESVRNRLWYIYSMSAQYKEDDAIAESPPDVVKKETLSETYIGQSSSSRSNSPVSVAVAATGAYHR